MTLPIGSAFVRRSALKEVEGLMDFSYWHEPSVPATARVRPEVGVELPVVGAGH
jgi:hypothetical protein